MTSLSPPPGGDGIDNASRYRRPEVAAAFDAQRRFGTDDYVLAIETGYVAAQVERLAGPCARVVDLGAGTGKLALALARRGHSVTALDQSPAMLERLQAKAAAEGLDVRIHLGDLLDAEPPGGPFDVAVSSRVLMHVADPAAMIRRMADLGRCGLILDAPRRVSPNSLLVALRRWQGGEVYRCVDDDALVAMIEAAGLTVIDRSRRFVLPVAVHLALRVRPVSAALETLLTPARAVASTLFVTAAHSADS